MATTNEVSSNLLLTDVLTTDTLPGSAAKTPILNPLSNSQNIGGSALIADTKTQPVIEPEKLSNPNDTLNSKNAITQPNSKKSDDSLIISDTLKSGLSESASSSSSVRDTLSGSPSGTDVKDTLTGISNDAPLSAIKDDTITAADSLTNPQSAEKIPSEKTPATLAEKETKTEIAIAQNTSVSEPKATTSSEAIKPDNSPAEKPAATVADISQDSNKTAEKPAATAADTSKDSNQEKSSTNSTDNNKPSTDNTEVVAFGTPKELSPTVPTSDPVADNSFTSGKFVVDSTGQVGIDFLLDGGLYKGQLAIISLKGMDKFSPGSEEFLKEAASRALSNSANGHVVINDLSEGAKFTGNLLEGNYNDGVYLGLKTFAMTPGEEFGVMLVPNGTVQEVLNNPAIGGDKRPLFSMVTANPAEGFHVGQIADVTGSGKTFTMEDMRVDLGSDRDYNDFVFQVRGATGQAVNLDSVINADKDWRKTDMGQALIAYAKPYVELKLEPAKEDAKPVTNSVATKDAAVLETKVTPTEEAKKEPIAPVSTPNESVSKTEVTTSDQAVTPAVTIEEEKEPIAPVSTPNESVSKTEVTTSDQA
ncbi:DUF4114 domain-containing protein, partial [Microcoleus sp. T2B6]|uniref:DUF4114 domain-containing protein n=1 Tax=Microcoleus sp. T2B6 TaxID=3055424 RepID=UPI002FD47FF9